MGVVFLYVVPTLRDQLIGQRFERLESVARTEQKNPALRRALGGRNFAAARPALSRAGQIASARVDLFTVKGGRAFPSAVPFAVRPVNPAVRKVAKGESIARGR